MTVRAPIPKVTPLAKPRGWRRLAGTSSLNGLGPGVATALAGIRYEVVRVAGQSVLSVRIKTAGNGGTLDLIPLGPDFDPKQVAQNVAFASLVGTKYTTGTPVQVAVVAGTEAMSSILCRGEGWVLIKFVGTVGAGTVSFCDVLFADAAIMTAGNSGGGSSAVTIADGADVTLGTVADAAVTTDANGTVSAKLRGLVKMINDVWVSASHWFTVSLGSRLDRVNDATTVYPGPSTTGGQGSKAVAAAGTPLQLVAVSTPCTSITITARIGNTKEIAWGYSNAVRATAGSEIGACLQNGDSVTIDVNDVQSIWIDAQVSGEGVSFTYRID